MTEQTNDIRVTVELEPHLMRRLGTLAKAERVSVRDLIKSILSEVAHADQARPEPSFLNDERPTRLMRKEQRAGHTSDDG